MGKERGIKMNIAIICAAGKGKRIDAGINKVFIRINGRSIIWHTVKIFEDHNIIDKILIITSREDIPIMNEEVKCFKKVVSVIEGGKERQDSVYNGIKMMENTAKNNDLFIIHNGANPLVDPETITKTINVALEHGASVAAFPVKDTIKSVSEDGFVKSTLNRKELWAMQTPQVIRADIAFKAFKSAYNHGYYATDDVALVEKIGGKVKIVECSYRNIKITTKDDIEVARLWLK